MSNRIEGGYESIVQYRDHPFGKCDKGTTIVTTAAQIAPVGIRIMVPTLVPNILQSDNSGKFLGETWNAVNRYVCTLHQFVAY